MASGPTVMSLCAGIGGIDLAVRRVFPASRLVCAVEIEAFASAVLAAQMAEGQLDAAPVWSDLKTFDSRAWRGCVDLLTAGFPCQPFSVAGKQRGSEDHRHLWPHVRRAINGARPSFVLLENVPGLLTVRQPDGRTAYEVVRSELQRLAYRVEAVLVTASEVGAPHKRERLFVLAVADSLNGGECWRDFRSVGQAGSQASQRHDGPGATDEPGDRGEDVADAERARREQDRRRPAVHAGWESQSRRSDVGHADQQRQWGEGHPSINTGQVPCQGGVPVWPPAPSDTAGWAAVLAIRPDLAPAIESPIRGVADGVSIRVDELRAYGNAVVPAQGAYALRLLLQLHGRR